MRIGELLQAYQIIDDHGQVDLDLLMAYLNAEQNAPK